MRRRTEAEAHRTFYRLNTDRLQLEALLQDDLTALHDRDFRRRELHIRHAGRPIRIRTTRCGCGGGGRRCRRDAGTEISVLYLGGWNRGLTAGRDRGFVLTRGRVATLVSAERRGSSGGLYGNGDIAITQTGNAKTSF